MTPEEAEELGAQALGGADGRVGFTAPESNGLTIRAIDRAYKLWLARTPHRKNWREKRADAEAARAAATQQRKQ